MTLPPFIEKQQGVFYHNWLYSVVPVSEERTLWSPNSDGMGQYSHQEFAMVAYLTGYCRNCGRAFSRKIDTDYGGYYRETVMNVPKEGCISNG